MFYPLNYGDLRMRLGKPRRVGSASPNHPFRLPPRVAAA